jgi:hypothetical protein
METDMRAQQVPVSADMFRVVATIAETLQRPRSGMSATNGRSPDSTVADPRRSGLDQLEHWAWRQRQRDTEAYLARSVDACDLEARIRDLERPVPPRYY